MNIAVYGLGYVGLPLAASLSKHFNVSGYDSNPARVRDISSRINVTDHLGSFPVSVLDDISVTSNASELLDTDVFIVTVPTPVTDFLEPDFDALKIASESIGRIMKKGALVIFESTVFPGCTEEVCIPILKSVSGFRWESDLKEFYVGYSPERINPGDTNNELRSVVKVISGCCPKSLALVRRVYEPICVAGLHEARSIKIAEAAKVIENCQRDLNIAFVNELSEVLHKMDIPISDVLDAAASKWNFARYHPGLVGGHCIGVDPYWLAYAAKRVGVYPDVILAGRRVNSGFHQYWGELIVKKLVEFSGRCGDCGRINLGFLGLAFKENCGDFRNSGAVRLANYLADWGLNLVCWDPYLRVDERPHGLNSECEVRAFEKGEMFDALVVAVPHNRLDLSICSLGILLESESSPIFDLRSVVDAPDDECHNGVVIRF